MERLETRPAVELCESGSRISIAEGGLLGFVVMGSETWTCTWTCALASQCFLHVSTCMYMQRYCSSIINSRIYCVSVANSSE